MNRSISHFASGKSEVLSLQQRLVYAAGVRIIAGTHRGRKLKAPPTALTRPITDRAKQSIFDILAPYLADAVIYDCFAGTGSMGLESLSRGAKQVIFFERERGALRLLDENLKEFGFESRSRVVAADIFSFFPEAVLPTADAIFLDPPYRFLQNQPADLQRLAERMASTHMHAESLLIFRHDAADKLDLPGLEIAVKRSYGGMSVEILRKAG